MNSKNNNIAAFNNSGALGYRRSERRSEIEIYQADSSPAPNKAGQELQALVAEFVRDIEVDKTAPFFGDRERRFDVLRSLSISFGRKPEYRPYFYAGLEEGLNDKKGLFSNLRSGDDARRLPMWSEDEFLPRLFKMVKDDEEYSALILRFVEETFAVWVCDEGLEPDTCYESLSACPELQEAALRSLKKGGNDIEKWRVYFTNKPACLQDNSATSHPGLKADPQFDYLRRFLEGEEFKRPRDFDFSGTSSVAETGRNRLISDPALASALMQGYGTMLERNGEQVPEWIKNPARGNESTNPQDSRTSLPKNLKGLDY